MFKRYFRNQFEYWMWFFYLETGEHLPLLNLIRQIERPFNTVI